MNLPLHFSILLVGVTAFCCPNILPEDSHNHLVVKNIFHQDHNNSANGIPLNHGKNQELLVKKFSQEHPITTFEYFEKEGINKEVFHYRRCKQSLKKKNYTEFFNNLTKIKNRKLLHNTQLMQDLYELMPVEIKNKFVSFMRKSGFFYEYVSMENEFFEAENRRNEALFLYKIIQETKPSSFVQNIIKRNLFIHLPEVISLKKLEELKNFHTLHNSLSVNDFLLRVSNLLIFGQNNEAEKTLSIVKDKKMKLSKWEKCETKFLFGKILRKKKLYQKAREEFKQVCEQCPKSFEIKAAYLNLYIAFLQKDIDSLQEFRDFVKHYGGHSFCDDILYYQALLLRHHGKNQEAMSTLEKVIQEYPDGDMLFPSMFKRAFWLAEEKKIPLAILELKKIEAIAPKNSHVHTRAKYWINRLLLFPDLQSFETKNSEYENKVVASLAQDLKEPYQDIFSWLSYSLIKEKTSYEKLVIQGKEQIQKPNISQDFINTGGLIYKLYQAGYSDEAKAILVKERFSSRNLNKAYAMAALFYLLKEPGLAFKKILSPNEEIADYIKHENFFLYEALSHPLVYDDTICEASLQAGLNEMYLFGIIANESSFIPKAVSWAGAYGLAQIMPATGFDFAKRYKIPLHSTKDLLNPKTNATLAARILKKYMDMTSNQLLGVASYNAGPSLVRSWVKTHNFNTVDYFLESIPLIQTQNYVIKVLSAAWNYGTILKTAKTPVISMSL